LLGGESIIEDRQSRRDERADQYDLEPGVIRMSAAHLLEQTREREERDIAAAHDAQIDAVEHGKNENAGEKGVDAEAQVDESRRAASEEARSDRGEHRIHRIESLGDHRAGDTAA